MFASRITKHIHTHTQSRATSQKNEKQRQQKQQTSGQKTSLWALNCFCQTLKPILEVDRHHGVRQRWGWDNGAILNMVRNASRLNLQDPQPMTPDAKKQKQGYQHQIIGRMKVDFPAAKCLICWEFQLDDSKSLHRKWLFHKTSILSWLFGVQDMMRFDISLLHGLELLPPASLSGQNL